MTINGFEPSRRVSSLLRGLNRRQRPTLSYCPKKKKKKVIGIGPPYLFYMSPGATQLLQNFLSTTLYQPPLLSIYCQLETFKIYHCYKAIAEI